MAFSADELRVLRRALATALNPAPLQDEDVQDCLRLAESVDDTVREAGRLRAFLLADLALYREALPGSLTGYLELLQDALGAGYDPGVDDLAALRALRANPRAAGLLARCQVLAERSVRARLARVSQAAAPTPVPPVPAPAFPAPASPVSAFPAPASPVSAFPAPAFRAPPAPRARLLLALPGGRAADEPKPSTPKPPAPTKRPAPKPSEVFPPRRRPVPPPPPEERAAG
ncbi:hypothetical protein Q5762_15090 [Streptomyces sp. P9(2023)]|uniref:hypothetical protein n=1 Tax=Streptomyces sp. P9(2023) TaxID=3064394 RepID=UPI0028F3EC54|nr:hypothetical protein [Streptomyces sp. P9(2023)]MDT9689638.1 hypothetical protein [Streptomyces sp. P9(2023)]